MITYTMLGVPSYSYSIIYPPKKEPILIIKAPRLRLRSRGLGYQLIVPGGGGA